MPDGIKKQEEEKLGKKRLPDSVRFGLLVGLIYFLVIGLPRALGIWK